MSYVIDKIYEFYNQIWESRGIFQLNWRKKSDLIKLNIEFLLSQSDTRLSHLPFMGSPLSMIILVSIYLYIVRNGKKWMEHRKPFEIERIIVAYNIVQIIVNSALFLVVSSSYWNYWLTFWIISDIFRPIARIHWTDLYIYILVKCKRN